MNIRLDSFLIKKMSYSISKLIKKCHSDFISKHSTHANIELQIKYRNIQLQLIQLCAHRIYHIIYILLQILHKFCNVPTYIVYVQRTIIQKCGFCCRQPNKYYYKIGVAFAVYIQRFYVCKPT